MVKVFKFESPVTDKDKVYIEFEIEPDVWKPIKEWIMISEELKKQMETNLKPESLADQFMALQYLYTLTQLKELSKAISDKHGWVCDYSANDYFVRHIFHKILNKGSGE